MLEQKSKKMMDSAVRKACDVFVSIGDISDFKGEILAMLLLKYLSDTRQDPIGQSKEQWTDIGLMVPPEASFGLLFENQGSGIGHRIDAALRELEEANRCLDGLFQGIKFDSILLGNTEQRDRVLSQLLSAFAVFDFRKSPEQAARSVAYACESFIEHIAELAGKRGGEFFTPPEVSQLIARLVRPEEGEAVADPCCGSGSLLIACSQWARGNSNGMGCRLFGQEINGNTWGLARLNMILHGEVESQLKWGDTLREPKLLDQRDLQKFEVVVSSPPFSLREWGYEQAENDTYKRYWRGIPPRTAGDYAFLSHMIETLHPSKGRMAMVVSLGVLFRGAAEQDIRKALIQENLIDAVIALPTKLFPHTGIAVALLVFRKKRNDEEILFVDASTSFEHGKLINTLRDEDLARIESTYRERRNVEQYARLVSKEEILKNKCNLSVTRYIHVDEVEEKIDLLEIREERVQLNAKLADLEDRLANLLTGVVDAED